MRGVEGTYQMCVHGMSKRSTKRDWNIVTSFPSPSIRWWLQPPPDNQDTGKRHFWFIGNSHREEEAKLSQWLPKSQAGRRREEQQIRRRQIEVSPHNSQVHTLTVSFPPTAVLLNPRDKFIAQHRCPDSAIYCFKTEARDDRSLHLDYFFLTVKTKGYDMVMLGARGMSRKKQKFWNTTRESSN